MPPRPTREDIIQYLEARDRAGLERTRQLLLSEGRPDLVIWLDRKIKAIQDGTDGAAGVWAALSGRQRIILQLLNENKINLPHPNLKSIKVLERYDLVMVTEDGVVISERGKFVLASKRMGVEPL